MKQKAINQKSLLKNNFSQGNWQRIVITFLVAPYPLPSGIFYSFPNLNFLNLINLIQIDKFVTEKMKVLKVDGEYANVYPAIIISNQK